MKKIALVYWPKRGNVEKSAQKIARQFGEIPVDVFTISQVDVSTLPDYDLLIFGGSTVGADNWKDTHTSKWYSFFKELKNINLSGKTAAIYGLGDQVLYPENFVDGILIIRDELVAAGANIVGAWPVDGYEHTDSKSIEDGQFIGLALDDDHQAELSDERIKAWVEIIKGSLQ